MSKQVMHTPGPWHVSQECGFPDLHPRNRFTVVGASGTISITPNPVNMENEANARLIAAAPELLAACKSALHLLQTYCEPETLGGEKFDLSDAEVVKPLFEAIAKAESR